MKQFGRSIGLGLGALVLFAAVFTVLVTAQAPQQPQQPMSFFVTSTPKGDGANYGGLAGADAHCQQLAAAAGRGAAKWVAYLSTQGPGAVNARDRIGNGPWYNARGAMIAANQAELHGDTIEQARLGNRVNKNSARTEKGDVVNGVGDMPNQHDILTGSTPDGRAFTDAADHTCNNWTSNAQWKRPRAERRRRLRLRRPALRLSWGTTTRRAAATVPGTPRTAAAGAASRPGFDGRRGDVGLLRSELNRRFAPSEGRPRRSAGPFFVSR